MFLLFCFVLLSHCTIKNKLPYNVINHTLTVVFPSLLNNILHSNLPIPSNPPTFKTHSIHHMHVYIRWLSAEKKQHSFVIHQVERSSRTSHNIHAYTPHTHTFVIIISTKKKLVIFEFLLLSETSEYDLRCVCENMWWVVR